MTISRTAIGRLSQRDELYRRRDLVFAPYPGVGLCRLRYFNIPAFRAEGKQGSKTWAFGNSPRAGVFDPKIAQQPGQCATKVLVLGEQLGGLAAGEQERIPVGEGTFIASCQAR